MWQQAEEINIRQIHHLGIQINNVPTSVNVKGF